MFIIVLGQNVSIHIESSSGTFKTIDPYLKCLRIETCCPSTIINLIKFFIVFLTVQYLIIFYIPTNRTNLLFIYKQHIKTFVLFKLLKLLHVSVTD